MKLLKKLGLASALIAAPFMATTAFAGGHGTLKYVLVSHAPDSDSWWNTIKTQPRGRGEGGHRHHQT